MPYIELSSKSELQEQGKRRKTSPYYPSLSLYRGELYTRNRNTYIVIIIFVCLINTKKEILCHDTGR